ncbi:copper resistance CopC family protein [Caldalkalibacillus salinus]|uniref:copper resistance CopC family protein n=1 Tax=Caldalkalibacillus salinus TaxID=2803787 RepID=UPI001921AD9F|nr:copper resistance protein CopC [Caldalkalibacillus salinus]
MMRNRPIKIIFWMTALFTVILAGSILPQQATAHTYLDTSNPQEGEVVEEPLETIELFFETRIENVSTFYLVDEQGNNIEPENIDVGDDTMTGTFSEPLSSGAYTLEWDIIGLDGHRVTGSFPFEVDYEAQTEDDTAQGTEEGQEPDESPNQEGVSEDSEETESTDEPAQNDEQAQPEDEAEDSIAGEEQLEGENNAEGSSFSWVGIVVFVAIVAGLLFTLRGRRA